MAAGQAAALLGRGVFIVAAKRTPFGAFGGKLRDFTATELGRIAAAGALKAGRVPPEAVDSVIFGNVVQVGGGAGLGGMVARTEYNYT